MLACQLRMEKRLILLVEDPSHHHTCNQSVNLTEIRKTSYLVHHSLSFCFARCACLHGEIADPQKIAVSRYVTSPPLHLMRTSVRRGSVVSVHPPAIGYPLSFSQPMLERSQKQTSPSLDSLHVAPSYAQHPLVQATASAIEPSSSCAHTYRIYIGQQRRMGQAHVPHSGRA